MTKKQYIKALIDAQSTAICIQHRRPAWICGNAEVAMTKVWWNDVRREYVKTR